MANRYFATSCDKLDPNSTGVDDSDMVQREISLVPQHCRQYSHPAMATGQCTLASTG